MCNFLLVPKNMVMFIFWLLFALKTENKYFWLVLLKVLAQVNMLPKENCP